jgi:hypothetical protein
MSLRPQDDHGAYWHLSTFTKAELLTLAKDHRIVGCHLMSKDQLVSALANSGGPTLDHLPVTQQFDVARTRFNQEQILRVSGNNPRIKFAHVKYPPWSGGWEPSVVLTVEFDPYTDNSPGHVDFPSEIRYLILMEVVKGVRPARPPAYEKHTDIIGKDGTLMELWIEEKAMDVALRCRACHGFGKITTPIEVTVLGDAMPQYYQEPCEVCHGTGRRP